MLSNPMGSSAEEARDVAKEIHVSRGHDPNHALRRIPADAEEANERSLDFVGEVACSCEVC